MVVWGQQGSAGEGGGGSYVELDVGTFVDDTQHRLTNMYVCKSKRKRSKTSLPPVPSSPQSSPARAPRPHLHNIRSSIDEKTGDHGVERTIVRPSQTAVCRRELSGLKTEPTRRSREHGAPGGVREEGRTEPEVRAGARGARGGEFSHLLADAVVSPSTVHTLL